MKKNTHKPKNFDSLLRSSISAVEADSSDQQDMSVINDYLSEHLKSFVLLGYDLKGESIVIISGKTPQDYDAIETLLRRVGNIDFFKDVQEQTNTNE